MELRRVRRADDTAVDEEDAVEEHLTGLELPTALRRRHLREVCRRRILRVDGHERLLVARATEGLLPRRHLLAHDALVKLGRTRTAIANLGVESVDKAPLLDLIIQVLLEVGLLGNELHLQLCTRRHPSTLLPPLGPKLLPHVEHTAGEQALRALVLVALTARLK